MTTEFRRRPTDFQAAPRKIADPFFRSPNLARCGLQGGLKKSRHLGVSTPRPL